MAPGKPEQPASSSSTHLTGPAARQGSAKDTYSPGLEGIVAAETRLSRVDGQKGELLLGGFPVEQLAPVLSFEEMAHFFLTGQLESAANHPSLKEASPTRSLEDFKQTLRTWRELPSSTLDLLRSAGGNGLAPMELLRMGAASLHGNQPAQLLATLPTLIAASFRATSGQAPIAPNQDLSHAANYLYMLEGAMPAAARVRALETYLNTVIDHGMNASTFAARVIISTQSDLVSALTGAIGALKGPLHGGAPGPVLDMILEIAESGEPEKWINKHLDSGGRLMGFGHRVYRVRDPRAEVLAQATERLLKESEGLADVETIVRISRDVEGAALRILRERKPERTLEANVEFSTAVLLHAVGLPKDLFTPTFAMARAAGWMAHCQEQLSLGKLLRPKGRYIGEVRTLEQ